MTQLHFVVPGLLGPFSEALPSYIQQQLKQSEFTLINKLLSKAKISEFNSNSYFETLAQIISPQCKLSVTQLTALADGIDTSECYFYRADPVHFKAESDHAILVGTDLLSPAHQEASELVNAFNQHFLDDNISLHFTAESRWYLKSCRPLELSFTALDYALGRDIKHFMPKDVGENNDALWWRKILNEAQMLFFQHEINQNREERGALAINGLWLWDLLASSTEKISQVQQLYSTEVMAVALANQSAIKVQAVNEINNINSSSVLVHSSLYESVCYGDVDAWVEELSRFCANELQTVCSLLNEKKIDEIIFYPSDGRVFTANRIDLLKFWKKHLTVGSYVAVDT